MKKSRVLFVSKKDVMKDILKIIKNMNSDYPLIAQSVQELIDTAYVLKDDKTKSELYYWHNVDWGDTASVSNFVAVMDYIDSNTFWYNRSMGKHMTFVNRGEFKHKFDLSIRGTEIYLYGNPIMDRFKS